MDYLKEERIDREARNRKPERLDIPFWLKTNLTIEEAAAYSGIGRNKLRELTDDDKCSFVLWVGSKRLIKRRLLDEFLEKTYSV